MSKQKDAIYSIAASTMTHPTTDWIYQNARHKMPNISLGSVYRNLKSLTEESPLLEIRTTKGPSRYDANVSQHSHLRCVECDRLEDLPQKEFQVVSRSGKVKKYKILETRVELIGLCPECKRTQ
jgi:Fur family transcriptional regulator, peroxide stress response regulator